MIQESGDNVVFPFGIFHKSFIYNYKGLTIINTRRKLKKSYTKGQQNLIIKYLRQKDMITF